MNKFQSFKPFMWMVMCYFHIWSWKKNVIFFFGIKIMIYLTHSVYDLVKTIKLSMKLIWIDLYILKHAQNFIQKININCWFLMATITII